MRNCQVHPRCSRQTLVPQPMPSALILHHCHCQTTNRPWLTASRNTSTCFRNLTMPNYQCQMTNCLPLPPQPSWPQNTTLGPQMTGKLNCTTSRRGTTEKPTTMPPIWHASNNYWLLANQPSTAPPVQSPWPRTLPSPQKHLPNSMDTSTTLPQLPQPNALRSCNSSKTMLPS